MQCTAKSKRTGKRCNGKAVKGKDKCRMHGGTIPVKHGLYSKYSQSRLVDLAEDFAKDPRVLDLRQHLGLITALIADFLARLEPGSCSQCGTIRLDVETSQHLATLLDKATRTIERYHKILYDQKYLITVEGYQALLNQIVRIIGQYVTDEKDRHRLADEFDRLSLPGPRATA